MKTGAFANTAQHALDRVGTGAGLRRLLPFLAWLPRVNRGTLSSDLVAALTGAIVVLPQGVAFATIAGMPPEYGLYAGMVPAIIAALFGSSWHLVSGPTTRAKRPHTACLVPSMSLTYAVTCHRLVRFRF